MSEQKPHTPAPSEHDVHNEACGCVVMPAPVTFTPPAPAPSDLAYNYAHGDPAVAPGAPVPSGVLTPIGIWRDLGYEGPLSHTQIVEALEQIDDYTPQAVAIEMTDAALRGRVSELERVIEEASMSGVVLDDERLDYVEVQIDRDVWTALKSKAKEPKR